MKWDRKTGFCCQTCASYAPKDDVMGRCRRHAPSMGGFPVVYAADDWCGDHRIGTNPSKSQYENENDQGAEAICGFKHDSQEEE